MTEIVTDERVEQALRYLAGTDESCAADKINAERWKYVARRKKAHVVILEEGTGPVKAAKADIDVDVIEAEKKYLDCLQDYEGKAAKRKTEQLVVEIWRTEQANSRRGNI